MKEIAKVIPEGAVKLSPADMNKIHFETGRHSERDSDSAVRTVK